ncbi:MAG: LacI family DNA-binding transcriptional regulator [Nocardioidaceae bacterium]
MTIRTSTRPDARPTLGDVARLAGVSTATASKAFNDHADVASATRERVAHAARRLGYTPRVRGNNSRATQIWVAFDDLANPYSATVLEGLLAAAPRLSAAVWPALWGGPDDYEPRPSTPAWIRQGQQQGAQAFVLVTTPVAQEHVEACAQRGSPLVVVDPASAVPDGAMSVGATNWRGGVQATEHLLALGHRRLAFVGVPASSTPGTERLAGFRSALASAGLPASAGIERPGTFQHDDGLQCRELLVRADGPTAIFAASDSVALGVLEAARSAGLRVPEDLSVVGFDDSYAAILAAPQLTTVRQPLMEMGRLALQTAVQGARGASVAGTPVQLATRLVVRGSTGVAPAPR